MRSFMPDDTLYVTSLRDPAYQLQAAYDFFSAERCFKLTFEQFLNKPGMNETFISQCNTKYKSWLMNGQAFDLGIETASLSQHSPADRQWVKTKIEDIDLMFAVVLIMDRLDESLIVMRDRLHWSTEDIVYLRRNLQRPDMKDNIRKPISKYKPQFNLQSNPQPSIPEGMKPFNPNFNFQKPDSDRRVQPMGNYNRRSDNSQSSRHSIVSSQFANRHKRSIATEVELPLYTELQKSLARNWNWVDDMLYSHFATKLATIINQRPRYYETQVNKLRYQSHVWMKKCVRKIVPVAVADNHHLRIGSEYTYVLTPAGRSSNRCVRLAMGEVAKIRLLNAGKPLNAKTFSEGMVQKNTTLTNAVII